MTRIGTVLAVVVVVIAGLAGCARPVSTPLGGGEVAADAAPGVGPTIDPCTGDEVTFEELPADAVLVRATRCVVADQLVAGDGRWEVRVDQEATTGLDALAAALRLPSEDPRSLPSNTLCAAVGYLPIVISVTDATGRQFTPAIAQGVCGAPLQAVIDAIAAVGWATTATTPVRQTQSQLSVTSGCADEWKPVVALAAGERGGHAPTATLDTDPPSLHVCRFDVGSDPDQALALDNGLIVHAGELASASTVDADTARELVGALNAAPTAAACATVEAPFAVVTGIDGNAPSFTVELGGCHRALLDADGSLRQLDADLVTRLLAA